MCNQSGGQLKIHQFKVFLSGLGCHIFNLTRSKQIATKQLTLLPKKVI